jgi:RNA polymerase sigma-70 factor (ECF subfamily)
VSHEGLVRAFEAEKGVHLDVDAVALGARLHAMVATGRAAWPDVMLEDLAFARYLARCVPAQHDVLDALESLDAEGLYLACACASRDTKAIERFVGALGPEIDRTLVRMNVDAVDRDDLLARLQQIFFFGDSEGRAPLIGSFTGRGTLRAWARSVAVKQALTMRQREQRLVELDDAIFDRPADQTSPDIAYMRELYLEEFRLALGRALQRVSKRERNLLRQHYLDGMSIESVARVHRVHRATAARWLAEARENVLGRTRQELAASIHLTASELESVFSFVRRQSAFGDDVARLWEASEKK